MKVGILTWYNHGNYGSALQAYALQIVLRRMGHDVEVIAYQMRWIRRSCSFIKRIKTICKKYLSIYAEHKQFLKRYQNHFQYFYYKHISFSRVCDERNIAAVCRKYDAIISGSDQIWSPVYLDPVYLLNFCSSQSVRKIAYAPSLGQYSIPQSLQNEYKKLLSDYTAISVRENIGAEILSKLGFKAKVVADPTMLLTKNDYLAIEKKVENLPQSYIFCYVLETSLSYKDQIKRLSIKLNLPIVGISFNNTDYKWMQNASNVGPCEFLWLINHSKFVVTNSFHCTIFSMIFQKQFLVLERFNKENPICQNSRMEQLSQTFGIGEHIIKEGDKLPEEINSLICPYDTIIPSIAHTSMEYLRLALS